MRSLSQKQPRLRKAWHMPLWGIGATFFLIELFSFSFLTEVEEMPIWEYLFSGETDEETVAGISFWPLAFGALWAVMLTGFLRALPRAAARIAYGVVYCGMLIYAGVQTGYFQLFREMMWLSDFRYASEGSDYFSVILSYPVGWWLCILGLGGLGAVSVWKFPVRIGQWQRTVIAGLAGAIAVAAVTLLPEAVFQSDKGVKYAGSDYGRAQSAEAAYDNMFNTHRLYQVCGIYQTLVKDVYANIVYPLTPGYASAQGASRQEIDAYFNARQDGADNEMTGIFQGKNVVLVLMESMDDWMIGEHTPTISRLMDEGINFENFYTPGYGGVRTFNSEFCLNTGSFLSSQGGYAFDYVTNDFSQSLASQLRGEGYSALTYHYNDASFYSRGVFSPAMGYEKYISYQDYVTEENTDALYSDQFLFDNEEISESFFRDGQKLNFIITRSAHLSYKYNEVLSYWALKQYPEYRGLTDSEEEDCAYLKAKLVDDMFARLLEELEANGELDNTVIVAMTDHYTYGMDDQALVMARSGVTDGLLVEKTPCFIWSADCPDVDVAKTLNTSDLLPTLLNMLGVDSPYDYIGQDAFDASYTGYALFSDGSWVCGGAAYNASTGEVLYLDARTQTVTEEFMAEMEQTVNDFVYINNLILETDYYKTGK